MTGQHEWCFLCMRVTRFDPLVRLIPEIVSEGSPGHFWVWIENVSQSSFLSFFLFSLFPFFRFLLFPCFFLPSLIPSFFFPPPFLFSFPPFFLYSFLSYLLPSLPIPPLLFPSVLAHSSFALSFCPVCLPLFSILQSSFLSTFISSSLHYFPIFILPSSFFPFFLHPSLLYFLSSFLLSFLPTFISFILYSFIPSFPIFPFSSFFYSFLLLLFYYFYSSFLTSLLSFFIFFSYFLPSQM